MDEKQCQGQSSVDQILNGVGIQKTKTSVKPEYYMYVKILKGFVIMWAYLQSTF